MTANIRVYEIKFNKKGLRKKDTKAKYAEIVAANPKVEFIDSLPEHVDLPPFALNAPHKRM